jgi:hypothetical protein
MSKNLNSKLKKEDDCTCDPSKCGAEGSPGALGRGPYGERLVDCTNYVNHLLSNSIGQIEHIRDSYVQYHQDVLLALHEVLNQILVTFVSFLRCTIAGYVRRMSG